jgi:hypothetical protein
MNEFTFSEETAKKTMRSQAISRLPLIFIAGIAGIYLATIQNEEFPRLTLVLAITLPILAIAGYIGIRMGIKSGTKSLMKNIYRLTGNGIEWLTPSGRTVIIEYDKIDIYRTITKGLLIKSKNKKILIPREIDNYNEISGLIREKV